MLDNHTHTIASGHAYSTVKEVVEEAARKNLRGVSITDHGTQFPGATHLMHFLSLPDLPKTLFGVRIYPGVELNILNEEGDVDLEERALKSLTTVMAGIHPHCYKSDSAEKNTLAFMNVMKNPYVKIIVHPGDPKFPFDVERVVRQAAKTGTALEINDNSVNLDSGVRVGGLPTLKELVRACIREEVFLSIGSDAHFFDEVGRIEHAEEFIDEMGIPEKLILNTSLEKFEHFIACPKTL